MFTLGPQGLGEPGDLDPKGADRQACRKMPVGINIKDSGAAWWMDLGFLHDSTFIAVLFKALCKTGPAAKEH